MRSSARDQYPRTTVHSRSGMLIDSPPARRPNRRDSYIMKRASSLIGPPRSPAALHTSGRTHAGTPTRRPKAGRSFQAGDAALEGGEDGLRAVRHAQLVEDVVDV